ncbi:MAG TPA: sulfatase [Thermoanaerobaculia bacterium]
MPLPNRQRRAVSVAARVAGLAAALLAAGCRSKAPPPRNVILIVVDTLRADHLGVYGYPRDTSPNFDALARGAALFTNARSQASCTYPSVNSILTSRYPAAFFGQPDDAMGIPAAIPSLADILHSRGFHTVAISASPIVRRHWSRFNPKGGYDRGFEVFDEQCLWKSADCMTAAALPHLHSDPARPLFLYLHYLDPHGPYSPPARLREFATGPTDKDFIRRGDPNPIADHLYKGGPDPHVTADDLRYLVGLYDDEIAYFDDQLGKLLRAIDAAGLRDDTLLVLAADHGEEFLEHGNVKHCHSLYDALVHTPLVVRVPGTVPHPRITAPVENLDIVPTILDYLRLPAPPSGLAGRSLRAAIEGGPAPEAPVYQRSAQGSLRSIADGRFKLIHDLDSRGFQLFDLAHDAGETRDVLAEHRRELHGLRATLAAWLAAAEGDAASAGVRKSVEADRRLRSLGYLD